MEVKIENGRISVEIPPEARHGTSGDVETLRSLHCFRWTKERQRWEASFDPCILLELIEAFGKDKLEVSDSVAQAFIKAEVGDRARLKQRKLFCDTKDCRAVDLEGYRFDTTPFGEHQRQALTCLRHTNAMALFFGCGLGKSYTTLSWLRRLKDESEGRFKVLIIAPLNTLAGTWAEEIDKHTPDLTYTLMHRTVKDALIKLRTAHVDIYLVNFEKIAKIFKELQQTLFDVIVIDESVKIANPRAKTTKLVIQLGDKIKSRLILSGFPAPQGELQYFSQMRFLSKRAFGLNYASFQDRYFRQTGFGGYTRVLRDDMKDQFEDAIRQYSFRAREEDYVSLPPQIESRVKVMLTTRAMEIYQEYHEKALVELLAVRKSLVTGQLEEISDTWISKNVLDQLIRLRQICGGFLLKKEAVWDDVKAGIAQEEHYAEIHNCKIEASLGLLEEIGPSPVIIWAFFQREFELLQKAIGKRAKICNSTVSQSVKEDTIAAFKTSPDMVLLAHPKSVGHGLTFTNCCHNIFYSLDWSLDAFVQAKKRTHRISQGRPVNYWYLEACGTEREPTVDSVIFEKLEGRYNTAVALLDRLLEISYDSTVTGKSRN